MIQRISRTKYDIYALDVESHNDMESIDKNETSIWLGCFINEESKVDDESSYFYTIDELIDRLESMSTKRQKHGQTSPINNICIYIYNLSFEWSFILPVLLKRGYVFSEVIDKDGEKVFNSVSTKSCSSVWQAQFKFSKKSGMVVFRDLAKIYGGGLGKVAKSFKLQTQKGEIDYTLNRLHNHQVTLEEKEYCFKDTRIIIDILLKIIENDDKEFWTAISMASYATKKMIKTGWPKSLRPYSKFREMYPVLDQEENDFLRRGVAGGITYAPTNWQFKEIKQKILHIDAHQMHPSQAYRHIFPYGKGEYFKGKAPLGKICCCRIRISYDYAKLYSVIGLIGIPFITNKEIVVWDFEIPTMYKCYENLKIEYIDGYAYKTRKLPWRKFYADNYRLRLIAKQEEDEFNILQYKLLNNSSYGKLLEKPHNTIIENYINPFGIIDSIVEDKPEDKLQITAKYTYLPVGSAIPAYSRVNLIETAFKFSPDGSKIVYFDTDSIFVLLDEDTQYVWDHFIDQTDFLGGWGLEEIIDRAQFTAPKRYKTETDGKATIKAGGINFGYYKKAAIEARIKKEGLHITEEEKKALIDSYELPYDEINIVSSSWQVQRAYRVKGGTIIKFQTKEMDIQEKYKSIYEKNIK